MQALLLGGRGHVELCARFFHVGDDRVLAQLEGVHLPAHGLRRDLTDRIAVGLRELIPLVAVHADEVERRR